MHLVLSKNSEVSKAVKDQFICTSISKHFQRAQSFPGGGEALQTTLNFN